MEISDLIKYESIMVSSDGLVPAATAVRVMKPNSNGWGITCNPDGSFVIEDWLSDDGEPKPSDAEVSSWRQSVTDDVKIAVLRQQRDSLLAETDFWALSDTTAMTTEQANYRQALRDLPSTVNANDLTINTRKELTGVTWPTKP